MVVGQCPRARAVAMLGAGPVLVGLQAARSHSDSPYGVSSPNVQTHPGWVCRGRSPGRPGLGDDKSTPAPSRDAGVCREAREGVVGRTASLPPRGVGRQGYRLSDRDRGLRREPPPARAAVSGRGALVSSPATEGAIPPRAVTVRSDGWSLGAAPPALGSAAPCQQWSGRWPGSLGPEPRRSRWPHPGSGASAAGAAGCALTPAGVGPSVAQPGPPPAGVQCPSCGLGV